MIDDISEPGAWARELAMQPRRCEWCRHYQYGHELMEDDRWVPYVACALLHHPLQPCADYEREPGADDDLWGGPAHMRQASDDERGEHE